MDVNLPKIKGYDAVSIIKAIDPESQIIMTTQKNDKDLELKVRNQDIVYYHIKSFDRTDLLAAIRDICAKRQKNRA
jgi:DNA-binding NarL/FixJ family response regulator